MNFRLHICFKENYKYVSTVYLHICVVSWITYEISGELQTMLRESLSAERKGTGNFNEPSGPSMSPVLQSNSTRKEAYVNDRGRLRNTCVVVRKDDKEMLEEENRLVVSYLFACKRSDDCPLSPSVDYYVRWDCFLFQSQSILQMWKFTFDPFVPIPPIWVYCIDHFKEHEK